MADQESEILHLDQPPPPGRDGRIIRMVNQILEQSFRASAPATSTSSRSRTAARFVFASTGYLNEIAPPSRALFLPIVSRFKILAKMDIAEKRVPAGWSHRPADFGEKRIDLRVNTVPTVYGEKMVMRILDKGAIPLAADRPRLRRPAIQGPDRIHSYCRTAWCS